MKRMLLSGFALTVCWLGAGNLEAAAIKAGVDTDWTSPLVQLSDSRDVPITLARHGYRYGRGGHGCYYGPPRHYRSHWGGYGYGHGQFYPRRANVYYGNPYGYRRHHHHGGFGLYIGF